MILEVRIPNGEKPTWRDCWGLNIGVGVIPELEAKVSMADGFTDREDAPFEDVIHVKLRFEILESRYVAQFVGVEARDVTSVTLREVRVAEVIRLVASTGIFVKMDRDDPPASIRDWWGDGEYNIVGSTMGEMVRKAGPVDWVLRELALVYNIALISSQPPAKAVEKGFGLAARTAARWIAKAREMSILTRPSVPGYEDVTELSDRIREKIARGESGVHNVSTEDLQRWGIIDGEHQAEA